MNWFQIVQLIAQLLTVASQVIPQHGVQSTVDPQHLPIDVREKIKELHEHVNGSTT